MRTPKKGKKNWSRFLPIVLAALLLNTVMIAPSIVLAGACCMRGTCTDVDDEESCFDWTNVVPGMYMGDDVPCSSNPCPPAGGCCTGPNGYRCERLFEFECGGDFQGDGTSCSMEPCWGACCFYEGGCDYMTFKECTEGEYIGGWRCDHACYGACCDFMGGCWVTNFFECQMYGGTFQGGFTTCEGDIDGDTVADICDSCYVIEVDPISLRVQVSSTNPDDLEISFDTSLMPAIADHFNLYRGTLSALAEGLYDHQQLPSGNGCGVTSSPVTDAGAGALNETSFYYLVAAACDFSPDEEGSYGISSDGQERPKVHEPPINGERCP